ncbi:hypothetical protein P7F88_25025 [Vibrio hannami]|uniref:hypothetical protein n=1 Tax=Vibrio hannami TaxID=2717094 RepID=UPI00240FF1DD|nr:hypothetical protein [Vibrio hannami]MDG3089127.1 hypothetical protein [Vibrio hannami]
MPIGICPETGRTISGFEQACACAVRALSTPLGTMEKNRQAGSLVPDTLDKPANPKNRMILINRIFRTFKNPHNMISDIKPLKVNAEIVGAGYRVGIDVEYKGERRTVTL